MIEKKLREIYAFFRRMYFKNVKKVKFIKKSKIDTTTYFEGKSRVKGTVLDSKIATNTWISADLLSCIVGEYTYITGGSKLENCKIGRFCSIGHRVYSIRGSHPSKEWISTSPLFYSENTPFGHGFCDDSKLESYQWVDKENRIAIEIGNDVWIGDDVRIREGVHIGNGAIIATGAVVVSDVEDYAIYGGVPAKLIRYRFTEQEREELLSIEWWNRDIEWIKKNAWSFSNINDFIKQCKNEVE